MKRALSFVLAALMLLSLAACGGESQAPAAEEEAAASTAEVTEEPAPTAGPTEEPTPTLEPTPEPTLEPTPEPTPAPEYRLVSVKARSSDGQSDWDYTFFYDNGGWLPSAYEMLDPSYTGPRNHSPATLAYDEAGRLVSLVGPFNGYEYHYAYDEAGRLEKEEYEQHIDDRSSYESAEYTYDENGAVSTELTTKSFDGAVDTLTLDRMQEVNNTGSGLYCDPDHYSNRYSLPLLGAGYNMYSGANGDFEVWLSDNAGGRICTWSNRLHTEEPQLTYDDNGYLIEASDGTGNSFEFIYEPIA